MKKDLKEELDELLAKYLATNGLKMTKKISSSSLFHSATYDNRIVYTIKDLQKLNEEGFSLDESAGLFLFNFFIV